MPDRARSLAWQEAALAVEARLRKVTSQAPERLDDFELRHCYPRRAWGAGWRVKVSFSDGVERRLDVVASELFPDIPVRTALVDHPPPMTWPHVEGDGILCLLPNSAEVDLDDPAAVAENLLMRSTKLIEDLIEGSIVERDFKEEFLTYWAYRLTATRPVVTLVAPEPPSRQVRVWTDKDIEVVGEDHESLARWVRNRFGLTHPLVTEPGVFAWLGDPPLPKDYPDDAADVRSWLRRDAPEAAEMLEGLAMTRPQSIRLIIGAQGRGGPGLIGVVMTNPKEWRSRAKPVTEPVTKGFRPKDAPGAIVAHRYLGDRPVERAAVDRADAAWIHGRGHDARSAVLLERKVVIFGCGSVGAPIAIALAQAGVGHLILLDPEVLTWSNVGRHPLGASAVGRNKAEALAERLQRDFPHLHVEGRAQYAQALLRSHSTLLDGADLIVGTTGSWAAESAINHWHIASGRAVPVLYGWTEAHACAGHAVIVGREGGCLQCGLDRVGKPKFRIIDWPDGGDANLEEPACGAHYQPYGPIELAFVTAAIAEGALAALLEPSAGSCHKMYAAPSSRVAGLGGVWSAQWRPFASEEFQQVVNAERAWPLAECRACGRAADARAA